MLAHLNANSEAFLTCDDIIPNAKPNYYNYSSKCVTVLDVLFVVNNVMLFLAASNTHACSLNCDCKDMIMMPELGCWLVGCWLLMCIVSRTQGVIRDRSRVSLNLVFVLDQLC